MVLRLLSVVVVVHYFDCICISFSWIRSSLREPHLDEPWLKELVKWGFPGPSAPFLVVPYFSGNIVISEKVAVGELASCFRGTCN